MMHTKAKFLEIFKETLSRSSFYVGDRLNKVAFCSETVQKNASRQMPDWRFYYAKKFTGGNSVKFYARHCSLSQPLRNGIKQHAKQAMQSHLMLAVK